jgi:hypothetical protein
MSRKPRRPDDDPRQRESDMESYLRAFPVTNGEVNIIAGRQAPYGKGRTAALGPAG